VLRSLADFDSQQPSDLSTVWVSLGISTGFILIAMWYCDLIWWAKEIVGVRKPLYEPFLKRFWTGMDWYGMQSREQQRER
jgi:hypothetical protein